MSARRLALVAALVAVALVVVASACVTATAGASTAHRRDPARDLEGVDRSMQAVGTFAFDGHASLSRSGTQQVLELNLHGVGDVEHDRADFVVDSVAPAARLHYVVTSDAEYFELDGVPGTRPVELADRKWARAPRDPAGSAGDVIASPSGVFENVTAPGQRVTKVGKDKIDGVRTTQYHVAGPALTTSQLDPRTTASRTMEVWIDDRQRIRQISQIVLISQGRFTQSSRTSIAYREFGAPVSVVVPPDDDVATVASFDDLGLGSI